MFNLCFGILWACKNWDEETNPSQDHVLDMLFSRDMGQTWQTARTVLNAVQFVLFVKPHIFQQKKEVGLKLPNSSFIKSIKHHQMCDTPKSPNFTLHPNLHPKMLSHVFFFSRIMSEETSASHVSKKNKKSYFSCWFQPLWNIFVKMGTFPK